MRGRGSQDSVRPSSSVIGSKPPSLYGFLPTKNTKGDYVFPSIPSLSFSSSQSGNKKNFTPPSPVQTFVREVIVLSLLLSLSRPPSPFHVHTNVEGKEEGKGEVQVCLHFKQSNTFFTPPLRSSLSLEICLLFLLLPCRGEKVE